jgi:hypothetical protein
LALAFLLAMILAWPGIAFSQSSPAKSADDGALANPLAISVKPELANGQTSTKKVEALLPGQTIKMEGGSDIRIFSEDGRIQITAQEGAVILYEGMVKVESKPFLEDRPVLAREAKAQESEKLAPQFRINLGKAEVQVVPGQEMRLASPLIISAVRGTKFSMDVTDDGSSKLNVVEGKVLSMARDGQVKLVEAGKAAELTSAKFTDFLRSIGTKIPAGGDWRSIDRKVLDQAVTKAFGESYDFLKDAKDAVGSKVLEAKDSIAEKANELTARNTDAGAIPRKEMAAKP